MNRQIRRWGAAALLSGLSALAGVSCAHVEHAVRGPVEALVEVPSAAPGRSEKLVVEASANRDCQSGVRALRDGQWEVSITAFDRALRDDPDDSHALYAKAVANEMLGRYEEALRDYRASQETAAEPSLTCLTAIERVKSKLGR